ncbi:hypothetical protein [Microbacterium ulmi]|uniref:Uncharacterized protein n=1 Tax=Microbacterium ulmi TaxID=179095 RepID=A0A7Y2PZI3_9MICO|nr:hypothetical protein [Microbacterium ulmi]NII68200.1 hypothetical protein [Microbacterium ulmi]NNH02322.1 hypothetical protein [Microbacterium ulmi]
MGHVGFSWVGLAFLLALFVPNIVWATVARPSGYSAGGESRLLVALERVGQVATTASALVFDDTNLSPWSPWSLWLAAATALMIAYEVGWARYFRSGRTAGDFYRPLWGVPVPLATLPCAAFVLLGVYGMLIPLIVSALVLSVGHIGIHLGHRATMRRGGV